MLGAGRCDCTRDRVPDLSDGRETLLASPELPLLQLLQEGASDLEVRPARVDVLEGLHERPVVLLHEVDANDAASAALAPDRVDEDAVELVGSLVDEILDLVRNLVIVVEEELAVVIKPVEGQVFDTDGSPLIL